MWVPEFSRPQEVHITPIMNIRRERVLSRPGEVLVDLGAFVEPDTVVARAEKPGPIHVLSLCAALGVPPDKVKRLLTKGLGDNLEIGTTIAVRRQWLGLRRRRAPSPVAGKFAGFDDTGYALIRGQPEPVEITAFVRGRVANVMPRFGVVVELTGALIQGVWGSGSEAAGVLRTKIDDPSQPLEAAAIDVASRGAIMVGGSATEATLRAAAEHQVSGLVLASLDAGLRAMVSNLPFPVALLEGFGSIPINRPAFELLAELDGHDASISGRTVPRWGRTRPEVIISRHRAQPPAVEAGGAWQKGDRVHITASPHTGQVGEIVALVRQGKTVDSGDRLPGCQVRLDSKEIVFVPWTNLERLR